MSRVKTDYASKCISRDLARHIVDIELFSFINATGSNCVAAFEKYHFSCITIYGLQVYLYSGSSILACKIT